MTITDEFIIEGALLAARNAKRFLEDGVELFRAGKYGTGCVVGVIALENVGRGRWLRSLLHDAVDPKTKQSKPRVPMEQDAFREALIQDHHSTIREGITGLQFRSLQASDRFFEDIQKSADGTPERRSAIANFKGFLRKVFNQTVRDFHESRTLAQYIEPNDAFTGWNDPQSVSKEKAYDVLTNTFNNYNFFISELVGDSKVGPIIVQRNIKSELESAILRPTLE